MDVTDIKQGAIDHLERLRAEGYVLDDRRFDRLNGWTYLLMMVNEAQRALDLSDKYNRMEGIDVMEQVLLAQALFRQAIVSYGKCYATAAPGRQTLDRNSVFKGEPALKAKHDRMIQVRNSFAAHNGDSDMDTATLAAKEAGDTILVLQAYTVATPLNEYGCYREVLAHCGLYLVAAVNKYMNRLEKEIGKKIRMGE
jgi:hypothetical protein